MKRLTITSCGSILLLGLLVAFVPTASVIELLNNSISPLFVYCIFVVFINLCVCIACLLSENKTLRLNNQKLEEKVIQCSRKENELNLIKSELLDSNRKFEALVGVDPLTDCLNRRAFYAKFDEHIHQALRYKHNICCVMVDLDHFKKINDVHGHLAGDEVLKGVASIIRSHIRRTDFVCRYGGEEFCIVLPFVNEKDAKVLIERIREAIDLFRYSDMEITASFGISSMECGLKDSRTLILAADEALYVAKSNGRNRAISYGELIHQAVAD
ncbi:GGDEF domain-containing protein [Vibrio hannami]|uniref:GGDEF domain-containing protein n=1 Tax=Vibrio hannami TaxID=2717094 RepID=UPI00240EE052|nr:GGDEF domain-containing protein [Vibrio hannami]MDG3088405.1 GGDEF domain-containing protein [Vibrio hannami]